MGKNIFKALTVLTLVFAVACQKKNSNKSNGPIPSPNGDQSSPNPNAGIKDEKAYIGLWMAEELVNSNAPHTMSPYFAAFSIGDDFSFTSYSQYFDARGNEFKSPGEILTVEGIYQLVFNENKDARLRVSEKFLQQLKDIKRSEKDIQKLLKELEEDRAQSVALSEDGSHLIHRTVYNINDQKPHVTEEKYVKINQEVYNQKASEYLAYLEAIYNEKAQIFEYVSGNSYQLVEQIIQTENNGHVQEKVVKANDIDSESSMDSEGKVFVMVNAKSIRFASNIKDGASINKKYSTRLRFFGNKLNNRLNLMFVADVKNNKGYTTILSYGEVVANDQMGMDIVQSNGTAKTIWRYRKVN